MSGVLPFAGLALHVLLVAGAAVLLPGLIDGAEAMLCGRAPPSPLLPLRELRRSWARAAGREEGSTFVFASAPIAGVAAAGLAALLVPSFAEGLPGGGDLLLVLGLLALSRLTPVLAALDGGAGGAGSGAAALAGPLAMALPAALPAVLALELPTGGGSLDVPLGVRIEVPALLAAASLGLVLLAAEGEKGSAGRPPGAGVLEALSGRDLALARMAGWLRRVAGLGLLGALLLPLGPATAGGAAGWPLNWFEGVLVWVVWLGAGALGLATLRAMSPARGRPWGLLITAAGLGLLAVLLELLGQGAA